MDQSSDFCVTDFRPKRRCKCGRGERTILFLAKPRSSAELGKEIISPPAPEDTETLAGHFGWPSSSCRLGTTPCVVADSEKEQRDVSSSFIQACTNPTFNGLKRIDQKNKACVGSGTKRVHFDCELVEEGGEQEEAAVDGNPEKHVRNGHRKRNSHPKDFKAYIITSMFRRKPNFDWSNSESMEEMEFPEAQSNKDRLAFEYHTPTNR
uniref:Uncharacterized protein n=1 Tax=Anopheles atroparvus TaxID=41427 RepID=A0A182IQI6_ANOAO